MNRLQQRPAAETQRKAVCISVILNLIIAIFSPESALVAQGKVFTLRECIRYAQEKSPAARIARKNYESAFWNFRAFKASMLPGLQFSGNSPGFARQIIPNILDNGERSFVQQNQAFSDAQLRISQNIPQTGGRIWMASGLNRVDIFGTTEYLLWSSSPLLFGISQPLFQYNDLRWSKKTSPIRFHVAEATYLEALEDISQDVTELFFDVFISQINLANAEFNLLVNDTVLNISRGRYNVGKIGEDDMLMAELAMMRATSQVKSQKFRYETAVQNLAIALGLPVYEKIGVIPPTETGRIPIDPEIAKSMAMQNRSDAINFELRTLEAESDLAQARTSNRFNADLNAAFGLNQNGSSLQAAYTQPLSQQSFSVGFQIPLFQWGQNRAQVNSAEASRERISEQIRLDRAIFTQEVNNQVARFEQLREQVEIDARADSIARRRFEVARNRYNIGKIELTSLQIAQNEKDAARAQYMQTLSGYWAGYYRLRRLTLFDFMEGRRLEIPERME